RALRFEVRGCAITKASAALMAQLVEGKSVAEAKTFAEALRETVDRNGPDPAPETFRAFEGIRKVPSRKRCATLPWEALDKALG
ncbi:MAG: iron-sulfur cluster assembly scaffold protein, partial [Myxococcota bacterium]